MHTVVFLTGFMGAGKTTVGRALAACLGWRFVDLDECIVSQAGCSIADLFRDAGESFFRHAETAALRALVAELRQAPGAVVALGGGAFVESENAKLLAEFGAPVVFLDAPVAELRRRCSRTADMRPLYADENHFRQLYEARRSGYMKAGVRVDTAEKTVPEVAAEVAQRLGLGENYDTAQN